MTRIIAGTARGRRLAVPAGSGTRPTSDRVREAVMATVTHQFGNLHGLRVLDLYAGSGALGLEAASRGAAQVVLVERDRRAAAVATRNASTLAMEQVRVVARSVATFLGGPATNYDLVFLDPPYALPSQELEGVLGALRDGGWLAPGALVVVERSSRGGGFDWPPGIAHVLERTYSETTVWYGQRSAPTEPPDVAGPLAQGVSPTWKAGLVGKPLQASGGHADLPSNSAAQDPKE